MLSTLATKPNLFVDYFQADASGSTNQRISDRFKDSVESLRTGSPWSKCLKLRKTVFLTRKTDDPQPLLLHSLFNVDLQKEDGAWKEHNIAMSGFHDRIGVWKVPKADMFKSVDQGARYKVLDILHAATDEERANISPLEGNELPEFKLSDVRNSVPIPPSMIESILAPKDPSIANLTIAAIQSFQDCMYEASESRVLFEAEDKLKQSPAEKPSSSTSAQIAAEEDKRKADRATLNKKWQKLADSCGIAVVIYLLNFKNVHALKVDNAFKEDEIVAEALNIISSRISGHFEALGDQMELTAVATVEIKDDEPYVQPPAPTQLPPVGGIPVQRPTSASTSSLAAVPPAISNKRPAHPSFVPQDQSRTFRYPEAGVSSFDERINEMCYRKYVNQGENRISEAIKRSILAGASPCGTTPAIEAPMTGIQIMTSSTDHEASIIVVQAFEAMEFPFHNISQAQIKAMKQFGIAWFQLGVPKGLSVFCNVTWSATSADMCDELLVIDVKREFNRDLTDQEISKLTKNHIVIPTTFTDTIRAMQTQLHLLKMFFGDGSLLCQTYEDFITNINLMAVMMEREIAQDDRFPAYLLLRVDGVIRRVVYGIVHQAMFHKIPFHVLAELGRIQDELENERYLRPTLPPWILTFENSKSDQRKLENETSNNDRNGKGKGKGKGKGNDKEGKPGMIYKDSVLPRIKITDDEFDEIIKKKFITCRPTACIKWHARGWCWSGCSKKKTHDSLSKQHEDEIFAFLQKTGIKK